MNAEKVRVTPKQHIPHQYVYFQTTSIVIRINKETKQFELNLLFLIIKLFCSFNLYSHLYSCCCI